MLSLVTEEYPSLAEVGSKEKRRPWRLVIVIIQSFFVQAHMHMRHVEFRVHCHVQFL